MMKMTMMMTDDDDYDDYDDVKRIKQTNPGIVDKYLQYI